MGPFGSQVPHNGSEESLCASSRPTLQRARDWAAQKLQHSKADDQSPGTKGSPPQRPAPEQSVHLSQPRRIYLA
ncbi:hypothetical protein ON010_g18749 [Phytophthora cinnamomi]|nr:hypothetical protein ON010_g18749 [Phytophthora cinnamomi]